MYNNFDSIKFLHTVAYDITKGNVPIPPPSPLFELNEIYWWPIHFLFFFLNMKTNPYVWDDVIYIRTQPKLITLFFKK